MKRSGKFYIRLFLSVFSLSAFTVGGGYVIVPLMRKEYVEKLKWVKADEMLDLIAIAQSSPGAMAVNTAILVGYRTGGALGAVIGVLGATAPPLISVSLIYFAYEAFRDNRIVLAFISGLKIGVAAVIIDVVIGMLKTVFKQKSVFAGAILLISFILVYFTGINVVFVILGCIVIGVASSFTKGARLPKTDKPEETQGGTRE